MFSTVLFNITFSVLQPCYEAALLFLIAAGQQGLELCYKLSSWHALSDASVLGDDCRDSFLSNWGLPCPHRFLLLGTGQC